MTERGREIRNLVGLHSEYNLSTRVELRARGSVLLKALCYKSEGRAFKTR
jgi:hypothetical protein